MHIATLVLLGSVLAAPAAAVAGEGCGAKTAVREIFDSADTNGDGALTQAEYERAELQRFGVSFSQSDTNADGRTTLPEYLELYERHHPPAGQSEA